ncbi:MAG: LURP-one-related family protein [Candidatus Nanopelagicales bacterium]
MGLRDRIQERRAEDAGQTVYTMRQKLWSIGDDYWIEDNHGNRVFKVDGKALRLRETLKFEDAQGNELLKIQERMARVRDTMVIEDPSGHGVASVKKAVISPIRDRWHVSVDGGPDISIKGNIVDHEYTMETDGARVAEVSKRWLRVADSYGVEVSPGQNPALVLAIVAVIDQMAHPDR